MEEKKEETKTETEESTYRNMTPEQQIQIRQMAKRMLDIGADGRKPLKYAKRGIDNSLGVPRGQIYSDFKGSEYVKDASGTIRKVSK